MNKDIQTIILGTIIIFLSAIGGVYLISEFFMISFNWWYVGVVIFLLYFFNFIKELSLKR